MTMPQGWGLWGSAILIIGFALFQARTAVKIARTSGPNPKLRAQFGELEMILPHSLAELRWFTAASLTAGFCEEFLFRGYLIWAFAPLLGWWGAAVLSLAVFTAAHAYQGKGGAMGAAFAGGIITLLVALTGSLFPAIVLHALMDASGGVIAWLNFREEPVNPGLA
jgi:membrane protease YdiL (CAAX protease family)